MAYTAADFENHFHSDEPLTVDGIIGTYVVALDDQLQIKAAQVQNIALAGIKSVPELERKMAEASAALKQLIDDGAVLLKPEQWQSLSPASGPVLAYLPGGYTGPQKAAFLYGLPTFKANAVSPSIQFTVDAKCRSTYDAIKGKYDPLGKWSTYDGQYDFTRYIGDIYLLEAALAATADDSVTREPSGPEGTPAESWNTYSDGPLADFVDIGSEDDNDKLPDMTGFETDTIGAGVHVWRSPGFLLADRDLEVGEKVQAWVVRTQDGGIAKAVALTADKTNKAMAQWPVEFLKAVNAAPAASEGGKLLLGGRLSETGALEVGETDSPSTAAVASKSAVEKGALNRLWCYGNDHRLFTNAPFQTNLAIAGRLPDMALPEGESVVVQVRDRTTLHLYETHLFTPISEAECASGVWSKALCTAINATYGMLRAGVRADEKPRIAPAEKGNALWVPQCSDLSVEVDRIGWRRHRVVEAFVPVVGATVQVMLYDRYSGAQLPGSPFSYKVAEGEADAAACLAAMGKALKASMLGSYLRLAGRGAVDSAAGSATDWALWVVSLPVRVVVLGVPGLAGDYEKALETPAGESLTLGTVYADYPDGLRLALVDRWTGHDVASWSFRAKTDVVSSLDAWGHGLDECLRASGDREVPLIGWGQASVQGANLKNVNGDLTEWTLWLPQDLECLLVVGPLAPEMKVKGAPPRIGMLLTSLRDSLVIDEAYTYTAARRSRSGSAKLFAWGGDVLSGDDIARLHGDIGGLRGDRYQKALADERKSGFSNSCWTNPESPYYLGPQDSLQSASVSALLASRLSRSDISLPRKDSWCIRLPLAMFAEAVSCSGGSMVLQIESFSLAELYVLRGVQWLEFLQLLDGCGESEKHDAIRLNFGKVLNKDFPSAVHDEVNALKISASLSVGSDGLVSCIRNFLPLAARLSTLWDAESIIANEFKRAGYIESEHEVIFIYVAVEFVVDIFGLKCGGLEEEGAARTIKDVFKGEDRESRLESARSILEAIRYFSWTFEDAGDSGGARDLDPGLIAQKAKTKALVRSYLKSAATAARADVITAAASNDPIAVRLLSEFAVFDEVVADVRALARASDDKVVKARAGGDEVAIDLIFASVVYKIFEKNGEYSRGSALWVGSLIFHSRSLAAFFSDPKLDFERAIQISLEALCVKEDKSADVSSFLTGGLEGGVEEVLSLIHI